VCFLWGGVCCDLAFSLNLAHGPGILVFLLGVCRQSLSSKTTMARFLFTVRKPVYAPSHLLRHLFCLVTVTPGRRLSSFKNSPELSVLWNSVFFFSLYPFRKFRSRTGPSMSVLMSLSLRIVRSLPLPHSFMLIWPPISKPLSPSQARFLLCDRLR